MDGETYQVIALGVLAVTGAGISVYYKNKMKNVVNYFIPRIDSKIEKIDGLTKKLGEYLFN